jgi:cupin 2 domain-containing protein
MKLANLFADLPERNADEVFEDVLRTDAFTIERIVSVRPSLPAGQWYDQEQSEWVLLLRGSAGLLFEGRNEVIVMSPGDHVQIPSRCRHRVVWTDPDQETIWLAIHYPEASSVKSR